MAKNRQDRCWPGYEPAPGKKQHSQASCRPKAAQHLRAKPEKDLGQAPREEASNGPKEQLRAAAMPHYRHDLL